MKPTLKQLLIASVILGGACEGNPPPFKTKDVDVKATPKPAPVAEVVAPPALPPPPQPAPLQAGMVEPFKLMNSSSMRTLDDGWKAMRRKEYSEARAAFHDVVLAYPDKPATRFAELRAAVLSGDLPAVPALWRELLARDYVGYARRLDSGKEMAVLRKSPQWPKVQAITAEMKAKHLAALEHGFFFVGRLRPSAPVLSGDEVDGESVKLALEQEVYHFDPGTGLIQRISDSGGKVLALHHDGQRGSLMVLTGGALKKTGGTLAFANPEASVISLQTLERTGPLGLDADASAVDLCFSGKGEAVWSPVFAGLREAKAFTLDATGTSLVASEETCGGGVATTSVKPAGVVHRKPTPEGVALSEDGLRILGVDEDVPVRATSAIRPESLGWSPGKKRFVYTGNVAQCGPAKLDLGAEPEAGNGLYVWDAERKRSTRVTSASAVEAAWMDDERLAYQTGSDKATKLTIHDFSPGGFSTTVKVPAGAGLFGIATVGCADTQPQASLVE
jgi:hypothetical protein